ncbi:hypothetical protein SAY86_014614 [Trapa natans]|uniref:Uncharacterized protein n=1 Tax=Trapa natans TaxID=22666 RepID=A0AAN7QGU3_TRANT|nr:hypothetical protein SAY86_014614 [Trapa natans]
MPSHGGNMGHALQGKRAFEGHMKYITPNKRQMLPYFLNSSIPEPEFSWIMTELHRDSMGQPDLKISKLGRDVTKFPIPHCMIESDQSRLSAFDGHEEVARDGRQLAPEPRVAEIVQAGHQSYHPEAQRQNIMKRPVALGVPPYQQ